MSAEDNTIRPFRIDVPDEEVAELRRRVAATRWPDRETVAGRSQGELPSLGGATTGLLSTSPTRRGVSGTTTSAKANTSSRK